MSTRTTITIDERHKAFLKQHPEYNLSGLVKQTIDKLQRGKMS